MSREKEMIENQLEAEQEYIVNKLQKQAMGLAAEKQALQLEKTDLKRQVLHHTLTSIECQMLHLRNFLDSCPLQEWAFGDFLDGKGRCEGNTQ